MAQTVAVVRANLPTSGTVDITSTGFGTPAAAIIVTCNANTTNNPQTNVTFSVGFWDGTNQVVTTCQGVDGQTTVQNQAASDDAYILGGITISSGWQFRYAASAITDGIRLTLTGTTSVQRYATVIFIAGVSASLLTFTPNATQDATQASASLGFAPKLLFCMSIGHSAADVTFRGNYRFSLGVAESGGDHRCISWNPIDGVADEAPTLQYSETRCVGALSTASGYIWSGEITTWGADTFTMTTRDGATGGSSTTFILALGGAALSYEVGTLTTPTSTGNDVNSTAVDSDALLMFLSTATGTSLHSDSGANGVMLGMADASGQFSHAVQVEDAAGTSNSNSAASATAVLNLDSSSGGSRTDMCDATVTLNSSDFTLNYSAVDGTARKGWWVAFGAAGGGGDAEEALTGSALTGGHGTQAPSHSIPL